MSNTSRLDLHIQEYITAEGIELSPSQFNNALRMYTSAYVWNIYEESYEIQKSILFGNTVTIQVNGRPRKKVECKVCVKYQYKGDNLRDHLKMHLRRHKDAVDDVWFECVLIVRYWRYIMLVYFVKQSIMH